MGYTHYWYQAENLDESRFKLAVDDCKKICDVLPIPLGDGNGENEPIFKDDKIYFNGSVHSESLAKANLSIAWPASEKSEGVGIAGDDPRNGKWFAGDLLDSRCCDKNGDGSYETFGIDCQRKRPEWQKKKEYPLIFDCCKTAFRPYDLNVQCCLIVFKQYFNKDFKVHSDGESENWNEARDICQHIVGYGLDFELDKE